MENEVRDPYEYEVDLRDYIKVIWEQKWLIVLIFIIAVGAALAFSLSSTPTYRTRASLIITSPIADKIVSQPGGTQNQIDFVSEFDYEEVGLSDELLEEIISDLDLKTGSGKSRSLNSLRNQMSISLALPESSDTDREKPVLHLDVTGSDRERIKEIADRWGELYLRQASEVLSGEIERYYESISGEHSQVQEDLQAKIEERNKARKEHNLQLLETKVFDLRYRYRSYISSLESKTIDLEKKRAQLRTLNSVLEDEPRYIYLERPIQPERIITEARSSDENSGETTSGAENFDNAGEGATKGKYQEVNDLFINFKEKEIDTDVEISSLEKEVEHLSAKLDEVKNEINTTQATIEKLKPEREELDRQISQLRETSHSLYSALEEARRAKDESGIIRLLDGANSIETLNSVNTKQNVAVAGVLGLFVGVLVAFFKNYMEGYEEEGKEEEEPLKTEDQE